MYLGQKYSLEKLSRLLSVSERTVRNYISDLNSLMSTNLAEIKKDKENEYGLCVYDKANFIKKYSRFFEPNSIDLSCSKNRVIYMSLRFLLADDYLKLDDFIDELYIGKTAINKNFYSVKKLLKKFNLVSKSRPKYGVKFVGSERDFRRALSYITKEVNQISSDLAYKEIFKIENAAYNQIKKILKDVLNKNDEIISDISFNNILHHILIVIDRKAYASSLTLDTEEDINLTYEYRLAEEILFRVQNVLDLSISKIETEYLSSHLLGLNLKSGCKKFDFLNIDLDTLIENIIANIQRSLNIDVSIDPMLFDAIQAHLGPALYRVKNNILLTNPLLKYIKRSFPLAFELAIESTSIVEKTTGIKLSEDEIGYIAIHIGTYIERVLNLNEKIKCIIVCTTGLATSKLVKHKILNMFSSKINVIDSLELYEIEEYPQEEYDLIISTIPLNLNIKKPYVYIDNILNETDYLKILDFIETSHQKNFLSEENIYLNLDFDEKKEVVQYISDKLIEKNFVSKDIYDSIMEREKLASSYIGNSMAIPHPLKKVSDKTFWVLATFNKEVKWDENKIKLAIFLIVNKDQKYELDSMYDKLLNIIENSVVIDELIAAQNPKEAYRIIKNI